MILPITASYDKDILMLNRISLEDYDPLIQAAIYGNGKRIGEHLPPDSDKTAVLYAEADHPAHIGLMILSTFPQVLYGEASRGRRATVFNPATVGDLEGVLHDDSYQNIILFGHGTPYGYLATDGWVYVEHLDGLGLKRKEGEVIKLTDNNGNEPDEFALRIASNPDNAKRYAGRTYHDRILAFLRERLDKYQFPEMKG